MIERCRKTERRAWGAWAVAMTLFLAFGCAGMAAREQALLPAMQQAWPSIVGDVERGCAAWQIAGPELAAVRVVLAEFRGLLDGRDLRGLGRRGEEWKDLHELALAGVMDRVQSGDIGPGVGASRLERLRLFNESMKRLVAAVVR